MQDTQTTQHKWSRLLRFVPTSDSSLILIGEPVDQEIDVGLALRRKQVLEVKVFDGTSVLAPGRPTDRLEKISHILAPLTKHECGSIRCIGLNYKQHAAELNLPLANVPTVFLKPSSALADPYPFEIPLPRITQLDNCGDYESELAVIIGKTCKNVSKEEAASYILGYTAANDVSSRTSQFAQSQWSFSKGFDSSCPIGPVVLSVHGSPAEFNIDGLKNGRLVQRSGTSDLIFSIPELISFLSSGTTLSAGTIILTGTPAGVGMSHRPPLNIKHGDEFHVCISPGIGTLVSVFVNEM